MKPLLCRIPFNRVGPLPVPSDVAPPQLYMLWTGLFGQNQNRGAICFTDEANPSTEIGYSFSPVGEGWSNWTATGWEDCEIGRGVISATGPDQRQYTWQLEFGHDGDPRYEVWGAYFFDPPTITHP